MKPVVLSLAVIVAIVAAFALASQANVVRAQPSRPTFDLSRGVLLSSRANLQVCVEPGSSGTSAAVGTVQAALVKLNGDERFRAGGYATLPWLVRPGCPQPGRLLVSGQRHVKAGGSYGLGPDTRDPSPFRLFVFVVPTAEIQRMFGALPFHFASQEVFCDERRACGTVSTALYVDQATIEDEARLGADLESSLGLRAPFAPDTKNGNAKEVK